MRGLAAILVAGVASTFADTTVQLPSGVTQAITLLIGGAGLRWYFRREEKRLKDTLAQSQAADAKQKDATAQEVYQRIERQLALDTEVKIQSMRAELAEANTAIAEKDAQIGRQNEKIRLLTLRIERLHDQLLALEAGEQPLKRRADPPA